MEILPLQFKTLYFCGLWRQDMSFRSVKSIYTFLVVTHMFLLAASLIIQSFYTVDGLFLSAPYISVTAKIVNYILCSREITNLRRKFGAKICQPTSQEERNILEKYKRLIDIEFWAVLSLTQIVGIGMLVMPVLNNQLNTLTLPLEAYLPYPISNWTVYCLTYVWQILGAFYGVSILVTSDSMAYGFILLLCAQYDIYYLRLSKIGKKNEIFILKNYIDHHVFIQDLFKSTQSFFLRIVTMLFCSSLLTLGASIFNVSQVSILSLDFLNMFSYYTCMLLQIYFYCLFGNQLTEKSHAVANAIYNSDWVTLDSAQKKGLKFIMVISAKGNILSHHGLCILNLNTFVWILKASYTAFNVLKQGTTV